jgi:hypothetical protein
MPNPFYQIVSGNLLKTANTTKDFTLFGHNLQRILADAKTNSMVRSASTRIGCKLCPIQVKFLVVLPVFSKFPDTI